MSKTPEILIPAIRQYCHNNGQGLVMAYDEQETEAAVKALNDQVEALRLELGRKRLEIEKLKEEAEKALTWRPIDTAPQDGTEIILFTRSGCTLYECRWDKGRKLRGGGEIPPAWQSLEPIIEYGGGLEWLPLAEYDGPTHWMPQPPNPTSRD